LGEKGQESPSNETIGGKLEKRKKTITENDQTGKKLVCEKKG